MGAGPKVCVYMACSLDGFIAGRDGDLSWLHALREEAGDVSADGGALEFGSFMATVGCLLMGRRTYDTVESFGQWPCGEGIRLFQSLTDARKLPFVSGHPMA